MAWDIWHIAHSDECPAAQRREIAELLRALAEDGPPEEPRCPGRLRLSMTAVAIVGLRVAGVA